jgi:hypothetical protein
MNCMCNNEGYCPACLHYKNVSVIIQSANLLNIQDPATYIRNHTKSSFKITEEECKILERMKTSQDMTEYKEYLLKRTHYIIPCSIIHITCPNCDTRIKCSLSVKNDVPVNELMPSRELMRSSELMPSSQVMPSNFMCCSKLMNHNIHDHLCMYYNHTMYYKEN